MGQKFNNFINVERVASDDYNGWVEFTDGFNNLDGRIGQGKNGTIDIHAVNAKEWRVTDGDFGTLTDNFYNSDRILRWGSRAFFGDARRHPGGTGTGTGSWVQSGDDSADADRLHWVETHGGAVSSWDNAKGPALTGAARSTSNSNTQTTGTASIARLENDDVGGAGDPNVWASYCEGVRGAGQTNGAVWGQEVTVVNFAGSNVNVTPHNAGGAGVTKGVQIQNGAGVSTSSVYKADAAVNIKGISSQGGEHWNAGMVFDKDALAKRTYGASSPQTGKALMMAADNSIGWYTADYNNSGNGHVEMYGDGNGTLRLHNLYVGSNPEHIRFYNLTSLTGYIDTNGYHPVSDARLKDNIQTAEGSGEVVDAINVRSFDRNDTGEHESFGLVAQELDRAFPEAADYDPVDDVWTISREKLIPVLLAEVKSLRKRVKELEEK
jgi:hypothetical protein